MLRLDGLGAAALTYLLLFILYRGEQVDHAADVFLEIRRFAIDVRLQDGTRQDQDLSADD